jgi:murein DD-endopeptidase MepM/ murein hydrolase activator NlpD
VRAVLLAAALACLGAAASAQTPALSCEGHAEQGGFLVCRTEPRAALYVDGALMGAADEQGYVLVGFDRDAPARTYLETRAGGKVLGVLDTEIAPQTYVVQRVDGLPPETVTPTEPEILARIKREQAIKAHGFASRADGLGFVEPWIWPVEGRVSGPWGNQRVLNGVPAAPHMGFDIAAPTGYPVRAPASGVVALAEPDMFYEGGLVFIDHGQGLISMYLHMSRLDVKAGDVVVQGQIIGAVGAKGRATGSHLCWRMKWRDRNLDPALVPAMPLKPLTLAGAPRPPR